MISDVSVVWRSYGLFSMFFFFFKQKTSSELPISDWSSDVCSSDLLAADLVVLELEFAEQGLDDLGHALLLEHAGVLVQGQEPQPRHHLAEVAGHLGFAASGIGHPADALEGRYHAQPVTLALRGLDPPGNARATQAPRHHPAG